MLSVFEGLPGHCGYLPVAQDQQKRMSEILLYENHKGKINYTEAWEYMTILRTDQELPWNGKVHGYVYFPFHSNDPE